MQTMSLPVDVVEADLPVLPALVGKIPPGRKIRFILTVYLDAIETTAQLRRGGFHHNAKQLSGVLSTIPQRCLSTIDLKARGHVCANAS
eukprot:Skav219298  [mRNA]  locus=scaffold2157:480418:481809:- [translate_table: standard]